MWMKKGKLLEGVCPFSNHICIHERPVVESHLALDTEELNPRLIEWLIEHDFNRLHQFLGYLGPVEHIEKELVKIYCPVLPMWSARTRY